MKIFQVLNGRAFYDMTHLFDSVEEARKHFAPNIQIEEAPDYVFDWWNFDSSKQGDARWFKPALAEGFVYDDETGEIYNIEERRQGERSRLHADTTNDTMQALRKIREGDKEIDWNAWLDALDEYNRQIEDTTNQKDYPLKVTYPEYPVKPTR